MYVWRYHIRDKYLRLELLQDGEMVGYFMAPQTRDSGGYLIGSKMLLMLHFWRINFEEFYEHVLRGWGLEDADRAILLGMKSQLVQVFSSCGPSESALHRRVWFCSEDALEETSRLVKRFTALGKTMSEAAN